MAYARPIVIVVTVLLLVYIRYYTAAQDSGCSPSPPSTLVNSSGSLFSNNNVPIIDAQADILQPIVGGHRTDSWAVFSATQVQQHGLWCQLRLEDTNNMSNSNIGDWYYPTTDNYTLLPSTNTDDTPYQSLKCTNQIGLVVDGNVTNYQGIVKCNTTVTNLTRYENYFVVYDDNVFNNYSGPTVEPTMRVSILSSKDTVPSVVFTMSFNVTFGPPSRIFCRFKTTTVLNNKRDHPILSREVIRSQYVNSSQPDMTRVTVKVEQPREERTYVCEVTAEGRGNIVSGLYKHDTKGSGVTHVTMTVAGTPTGVTASRTGYTSVLVSWTAPSLPPAGYEVFYQSTAVNSSRLSGGNTNNTKLTLTGLTLVETYNIFVVAFGEKGAPVLPSSHSNTVKVILSPQIPQLTEILILNTNSSSIMVSWSSPEEFAADIYNVSYSCQNFCGSQLTSSDTVSGTAITHTISSLNASSSCTVDVTAVFGSNTSNTVTNTTNTKSTAPTDAPGGLTNTSVESRSLSVVWETIPCSHQSGPITGYRLHYSINASNGFTVNGIGDCNRQYKLTQLTPFTNYSVQVAAVNDGGAGPYSTPLTVETLQDFPGPVFSLSVISEGVLLTILWRYPTEPNGVIIVYEVCSNSSGVFSYTNTSATQHTLGDLPPDTVVTFGVRAYTIIGPGEYVTGQTTTGSVPIICGMSMVPLNSTSVRVSWTPVNLSVLDHYTVHYTTVGGVNDTVSFPATSSSGVVTGLQGGQEYWFGVTVTLNVSGKMYSRSPHYRLPPIALTLMETSPICSSHPTQPSFTATSFSSVVVMVIGWVLFTITLIVYGTTLLVWIMRRRHSNNKTKSSSLPVNDVIYDNPVPPEKSEEMKMTECAAYNTHKLHYTDEYEHVTTT